MAQPIPEFLVWYITILGVLPCAYQYRDLFVIQMISANKRLIGDRRLSGFYRYNIKVLNLQSPRDDFLIDFDMFSRINCKVSCPFCPFWRQLSKKWLTVSSAIFSGPSSGSSCFVLQHRWRNYNASSIFILSSIVCSQGIMEACPFRSPNSWVSSSSARFVCKPVFFVLGRSLTEDSGGYTDCCLYTCDTKGNKKIK